MKNIKRIHKVKDFTGQKFGRLLILSEGVRKTFPCGSKKRTVNCLCDCGIRKTVILGSLKNKNTKSCGCHDMDTKTKHGMIGTPVYTSWNNMKGRCTNVNDPSYKHYGGRGITVCERWMKFENFFEDMGERPSGTSIDRTDNDGNYCKENCRWATTKEQSVNKRNNVYLEYDGKRMTISQWVEKLNISRNTINSRIYLRWSDKKILTTPIRMKTKSFVRL